MPPRRAPRWDVRPPVIDLVALGARIEEESLGLAEAYLEALEAAVEPLGVLHRMREYRRGHALGAVRTLARDLPGLMEPFSVAFCEYWRLELGVIARLRREFVNRGLAVPHGARRMTDWEEEMAAIGSELGLAWLELVQWMEAEEARLARLAAARERRARQRRQRR
ncbi:uncharacterized protein BDZ99DRAFT_199641 [Mytilinidion resinicola]|uniref:Uncharacterized protein n=1 Tax=Mytilinidion resinicola TaxID=574789 RepID=A0A6A6Y2J9_9PEZI|nr:uncharacterized protein BDZ99DRAFT_199641 [Mytilinidion resinicola]KAF2802778.1 hypothetical protein BDZ99DRAFT_199641 [Mytilinidion resinicola]